MQTEQTIKSLHPLEVRVLRNTEPDTEISGELLRNALGFKDGQANQALSWLSQKGFVEEAARSSRVIYELTEMGASFLERGTPEERIVGAVREEGPKSIPELVGHTGLENKDVGSAFGSLSKAGVLKMNDEKLVELVGDPDHDAVVAVRRLLEKARADGAVAHDDLSADEQKVAQSVSKKRGAAGAPFRLVERDEVSYRLTGEAVEVKEALERAGITGEEIGALTPEILRSGEWKEASFREYNIHIPPTRVLLGRRNPYCLYLDSVKDKLTSLGFEEFDGPLVETEFWNSDALFMPQFHAARDIHDVYYIEQPDHAREIEQPYLDQVAKTHEDGWKTESRGWNYPFDRDFTKRLILRSQGTVMSAKTLPRAKVPGKYFGVLRCFRHDQVDATHLSDFYQTEGIVLGEDVNLPNLLGLLKMFAEEVAGASEVKYVPGYFPFTEPSVEVHIKHPVLGWFELGGSGIFRPEVTRPLGIDVPVLAWGLGIDRMALMHLGLNDLRELFSYDIENVRLRRGSRDNA